MSKFVILLAVLCVIVLSVEARHHRHHEEKQKAQPTPAEEAAKKARHEARKKLIRHIAKKVALHVLKAGLRAMFLDVNDFPDQDLDFSSEELGDWMNDSEIDDDFSFEHEHFVNKVNEIYAH
ncbi:hypothetical protein KR067_010162 [Drosophila pandora]|nr:hypothetical protein KR067_010162 [Drosophila pandora]